MTSSENHTGRSLEKDLEVANKEEKNLELENGWGSSDSMVGKTRKPLSDDEFANSNGHMKSPSFY